MVTSTDKYDFGTTYNKGKEKKSKTSDNNSGMQTFYKVGQLSGIRDADFELEKAYIPTKAYCEMEEVTIHVGRESLQFTNHCLSINYYCSKCR